MKKYKSKFKLPTPLEAELLTILIEEAAEVIQRATKLKRFGRDEVQKKQKFTNRQRLGHEVGDFFEMVKRCCEHGLIALADVEKGGRNKKAQLQMFMQEDDEVTVISTAYGSKRKKENFDPFSARDRAIKAKHKKGKING
jgi:hypothetical protein